MARLDTLKRIQKALSPNKIDFSAFDTELEALKKKLEESIYVQTVDEVKTKLKNFQGKVDLSPLMIELEKIRAQAELKQKELLTSIIEGDKQVALSNSQENSNLFQKLSNELNTLENTQSGAIDSITQQIRDIQSVIRKSDGTINALFDELNTFSTKKEQQRAIKELQDALESQRLDILARINTLGGGSMNRQIFINGANPLTKYNDINLKAGSNVTITYVNNDTTKKVDVTITSSGGGGGGTVRSINSISISTAAGNTSGTDYVYLCTGTLTLTLPDANSNQNLYTIKNVGTGVVTVATTSSQLIDSSTTAIMPLQYTSVDIISDTVSAWSIT